ncbi:hypothetical protein SAMN04515620_102113 [Collimonas sp. OK607]|uniref:hypothetical protein n=1 Tax=Collimonas sp. OK607 TaxID=1798194 RepID=UPI0008E33538|nr:hypothetical protein [Collimonas sp. OK607]SFA75092.1 hypothetical protein SAMN04515620_102113 [Collimonas sp. OK607]
MMPKQPTAEQLRVFKGQSLSLNPGSLSFEADIRTLKADVVFRWLDGQPSFKQALQQLQTKPGFTYGPPNSNLNNWTLLQFCGTVAECFADYFDAETGKLTIKVLPRSVKKKALEPIRTLNNLIKQGVGFLDQAKTAQLLNLLTSLAAELANDVPSRIPNRKSIHLPKRILIQQLGTYFFAAYDEFCPGVIEHLVGMIDPNIDERSVQRELKHVRTLIDARSD